MKKSPKQQILELVGAEDDGKWSENAVKYKKEILNGIISYLDRYDNETESELRERLLGGDGIGGISNKKLLKLHKMVTRLKDEFGGDKDNLIAELLKIRQGSSGKIDEGYRIHLQKKSIHTLMLMYDHAIKTGKLERAK